MAHATIGFSGRRMTPGDLDYFRCMLHHTSMGLKETDDGKPFETDGTYVITGYRYARLSYALSRILLAGYSVDGIYTMTEGDLEMFFIQLPNIVAPTTQSRYLPNWYAQLDPHQNLSYMKRALLISHGGRKKPSSWHMLPVRDWIPIVIDKVSAYPAKHQFLDAGCGVIAALPTRWPKPKKPKH